MDRAFLMLTVLLLLASAVLSIFFRMRILSARLWCLSRKSESFIVPFYHLKSYVSSFVHIDLLISGIISINFTMKNANMLKPSQVLKFIEMTIPKNAPAKCKAKYNAQNSSFIITLLYSPLTFKCQ